MAGTAPSNLRRVLLWLAGSIIIVALLAFAVAPLADRPLRQHLEKDANSRLKGYKVRIGGLEFHPLGFSLDLRKVLIVQEVHPDLPVARIPHLHTSIHWSALVRGRLVADFLFDRPILEVSLGAVQTEAADKTKIKDHGWQEAAYAIYPLKINLLRIEEGTFVYREPGPFEPVEISHVNFSAANIRNVRSKERDYPSDIHLSAIVSDHAILRIDGNADFLKEPYAGFKAQFRVQQIPIAYFQAILHHYNLKAHEGTVSLHGEVEYAPRIAAVDLDDLDVDSADIDFISPSATKKVEATPGRETAAHSQSVGDAHLQFGVHSMRVANSTLGYIAASADPPYHLFLGSSELAVQNLGNRLADGPGTIELRGQFMGSGPTDLRARFYPSADPQFALSLQIGPTELRTMNDLWLATGGFDVAGGSFSLYSEIGVRKGQIDGYIKPLFRDVHVYDPAQDKDKPLLKKIYKHAVGGLATLLENHARHEVATRTTLSGRLENPKGSIVEIIVHLIQNAYVKAILPGLDRERTAGNLE